MTLKLQEVANFGMFFHVMGKLFTLFLFVYNKNKDMPLWIGSIDVQYIFPYSTHYLQHGQLQCTCSTSLHSTLTYSLYMRSKHHRLHRYILHYTCISLGTATYMHMYHSSLLNFPMPSCWLYIICNLIWMGQSLALVLEAHQTHCLVSFVLKPS